MTFTETYMLQVKRMTTGPDSGSGKNPVVAILPLVRRRKSNSHQFCKACTAHFYKAYREEK